MPTEPVELVNETDDGPASLEVPKRRFGRIRVIMLLSLLLLLSTQFLNHTGFCYSEMKYLSEQETIDRFLFKDRARTMSFDEKVKTLKEKNGAEYPHCCRLQGDPLLLLPLDEFIHKVFGRYLLEFSLLTPNEYRGTKWEQPNEEYRIDYLTITACGISAHESYGQGISKQEYESSIATNKRYWEDKVE